MTVTEPDWTSDDALALRAFLFQSKSGKRLLERLAFERPEFSPSNAHPHKSFAQSRDIAGYEKAVGVLVSLTEPPPEQPLIPNKPTQTYPDLDDDSQWEPSA